MAYARYFLNKPNVMDSLIIGYWRSVVKGLMNFDVANAPGTSSTRMTKNADTNEFELMISFDNNVKTLF